MITRPVSKYGGLLVVPTKPQTETDGNAPDQVSSESLKDEYMPSLGVWTTLTLLAIAMLILAAHGLDWAWHNFHF